MNNLNLQKLRPYILSFYAFLIFVIFYHILFAHKIIPGVKVGGVKIGGKSYSQAKEALVKVESKLQKELVLRFESQSFTITAEEVGLLYDVDGSVSRAFEVGRTGNFFTDTKEKVAGLFKSLYIGAFYDFDDDLLAMKFAQIKGEINVSAQDASVSLNDEDDLLLNNSANGQKVVDGGLYKIVIASFDRMEFSQKTLPIRIIEPKIVRMDLENKLDEVKKIVVSTLNVNYNGKTWVLNSDQLINFLGFAKDEETGEVEVKLNEPKFEAFTETLSADVNELPRGEVTKLDGDIVLEFKLTQDGKELDVKEFTESFKDVFYSGGDSVELPMKAISGPDNAKKYGITALLGEGSSTFTGSGAGRVHNLTLAAERTSGVLVAPGKVYSMNNSVGDISAKTGYQTAWIIKGDRTVLGSGGGVCQTSTTLFRAVLNSGLPVVTRYPHAYRVSYYEQDRPVGYDATIYQPSWDFQFKNDTENYVLVQAYPDPSNYALNFKIFGTPDGRVVEVSEPVITNQSPPPPALYQDDSTLAKGVTKQVDFPAWGASVKFTRRVTKGDEVIIDDVFSSRYQPWRAIYLVGTRE